MGISLKTYNVGKADCFLITIDDEISFLVDGGYGYTMSDIIKRDDFKERLKNLYGIILTHIDRDHIGGILKLLENESFKEEILKKDNFFIVFNDYVDPSTISYKQGIRLKQFIEKISNIKLINTYFENHELKIKDKYVILKCVKNRITSINQGDNSIVIEFISPTKEILKKFMKNWKDNKNNANITNDSSIVFLLSYQNKNILMTGDSSVKIFQKNLFDLQSLKKIDIIKLPHHGSENGNNDGILRIINDYKCEKIIVSTKETDEYLDKNLIESIEEKIGKNNVVYSYSQNNEEIKL